MSVPAPIAPEHPALAAHMAARGRSAQNRIADAITRFAGSMWFVYLHVVWFSLWIALGVEDFPYGLLTMIVSLEAIFLSTFVMISQNRSDAARQALADHQYRLVETESRQSDEVVSLSREVLALTQEMHRVMLERRPR